MSRFSQVKFNPVTKADPDYEDIKAEQKALKLKDSVGRDVSVGSKVMLPNPKEEGTVVHIDDDRIIVRTAPPHRMGPASDVTCIRKCGRKPRAPKANTKPKKTVKFASTSKSRGKTRKNRSRNNGSNNSNNSRLEFLLKALKLHNESKSRGKTLGKSRGVTRKSRTTAN